MNILSVYATFPTEEEARAVARQLVEERLAACANILGPCHSIYRWDDRVQESGELAAIFKCAADNVDALIARLCELHSYEVPAVVAWPVAAANPLYTDWVATEVHPIV